MPASLPAGLDLGERRRRRQALSGLVVLAILLVLPLGIGDVYVRNILILTLMYTALSQAWNILGGYCGQISLGHALYFGIGAYVSTLLFTKFGVPPMLGMVAAGFVAALIALVVSWPCFRLSGHYYAIATIVIAEIVYLLFLNWDWVGGALGINVPFRGESWVSFQFRTAKLPYYYAFLGLAAVLWLASYWIENSKWGFYWRAVKDNPIAAQSLGVRLFRSKMVAAAASAFFTGIGGSFYAQFVAYIDPDSMMNAQLSILICLPAVLGGIGTLWGPAVGAAVLIPLTEVTRSYIGGSGSGTDLILYGVLIMAVATLKPEGLTGLFRIDGRIKPAAAPATGPSGSTHAA
ncbi:MAG TPA: branched-chain amino acid ABC transporter permease [Stellaceae bacterium]|nr:branched-chain amino acid ABC transporter permease [Stellaceae bacterium]